MKIVYHQKLEFGSAFLNRFHPFESDRPVVAFSRLKQVLAHELEEVLAQPSAPVELSAMELVHSKEHLQNLNRASVYAQVVEVPFLRFCPRSWLRTWFLEPALWSVAGSLLAARHALEEGFALLLGGGFHHAKRDNGEGFCLLSDIAFVIETLRADKTLGSKDKILYLDLDVHQGNGVSDYYAQDPRVKIMDAFNADIYPVYGHKPEGLEVALSLKSGCGDEDYLRAVSEGLEEFLSTNEDAKFLIYNAGTDIFCDDRLGGLKVSKEGVNRRDLLVLESVHSKGIPMLALASGGYSSMSAELLCDLALAAHRLYR